MSANKLIWVVVIVIAVLSLFAVVPTTTVIVAFVIAYGLDRIV